VVGSSASWVAVIIQHLFVVMTLAIVFPVKAIQVAFKKAIF
jgi:hypothetical protein